MLIFRSEEHLDRWLAAGHPAGERMTIDQQWALANSWFAGRHETAWTKRTPAEAETVLRDCGLTGTFWRLET
jgi:hypothetical protein